MERDIKVVLTITVESDLLSADMIVDSLDIRVKRFDENVEVKSVGITDFAELQTIR